LRSQKPREKHDLYYYYYARADRTAHLLTLGYRTPFPSGLAPLLWQVPRQLPSPRRMSSAVSPPRARTGRPIGPIATDLTQPCGQTMAYITDTPGHTIATTTRSTRRARCSAQNAPSSSSSSPRPEPTTHRKAVNTAPVKGGYGATQGTFLLPPKGGPVSQANLCPSRRMPHVPKRRPVVRRLRKSKTNYV
jgi:hypothetical protein